MPPSGGSQPKGVPEEKDRTLTRRTVKGAAGGLAGVDYEEERKPEASGSSALQSKGRGARPVRRDDDARSPAPQGREDDRAKLEGVDSHAQASTEAPETIEARLMRRRAKKRGAPAEVRGALAEHQPDEEDEPDRDDAQPELFSDDALDDRKPGSLRTDDRRGPEPGDLSVLDPSEIERRFRDPVAYAKHAMLIAEAFRASTGATRAEGIDYLARLMLAPSDRALARSAFRELGPATGIVDLYPLEVLAHAVETYPGHLPKAGFGSLVRNGGERRRELVTDTRTPIELEYSPDLRIRAFALVGGGRPGYRLDPGDAPGTHLLSFDSPGRFEILISGATRAGYTIIDRLWATVHRAKGDDRPPPDPEASVPRDAEKLLGWPMPVVRPVSIEEALGEVEAAPMKRQLLSARDLAPVTRASPSSSVPELPSATELPDVSDLVVAAPELSSSIPALGSSAPVGDSPRSPSLSEPRGPALEPTPRGQLSRESNDASRSAETKEPPKPVIPSVRLTETTSAPIPRFARSKLQGSKGAPRLPVSGAEVSGSSSFPLEARNEPGDADPRQGARRKRPPDPLSSSVPEAPAKTVSEGLKAEGAMIVAAMDDDETSASGLVRPPVILDDSETEAIDRHELDAIVKEYKGRQPRAPSVEPPTQPIRAKASLLELDPPTEAIDRADIEAIVREARKKRE